MTFPVAILSGGLATRIRPLTEKIPKSLLQISGKPFIHWQLSNLSNQGIENVVLCVGYLGELIQDFVGDGSSYNLSVTYAFDGGELLGTGGAIKKALPLLGTDFFILYGDSYLPINFKDVQDFYLQSGMPGLMTVLKNKDLWDKSNVIFQNGKISLYDKMNISSQMHYIDYGLGLLNSSVFNDYPKGSVFDLSTIYNHLSLTAQLAGFEVFQRFYEIGSINGIADTEKYITNEIMK